MKCKNLFLLVLVFLGTIFTAKAQTYVCEPNLDFELGDLSHWNFYRGTNTSVLGTPTWTLTSCSPIYGLHTLKGLYPGEVDTFGKFPVVGDGVYSLKLNKDTTLYNADAADYHVHVPVCSTPGSCTYSLIYRYAIVLQDPGHSPDQQPRFEVSVTDSATGAPISCNSFQFVSSSVLPGFKTSTISPNPVYKPWTAGSLNLTSYAGKTIIVAFRAGACGAGGHWGYGYCDLNCGIFQIKTVGCRGGFATLDGPPGYAGYTWTDSATYTASYGSTPTVTVTVPTITTTYALIITPYPKYGCPDTLFARLSPSNMVTHPSRDTELCFGSKVRMWSGATDIYPLTFTWLPTTGVTCPTCDTTFITPPVGTTHYKVTAYNPGGCLNTDTINITVHPRVAKITGDSSICLGSYGTAIDSTPGGIWTSSATIVSVGSITGVVNSNGTTSGYLGTATITYAFPGNMCPVFRTVTVNPLPSPITGPPTVCVGFAVTLSDASTGTWSSSAIPLATVGSSSGIVTGMSAGTPTITFTSNTTGCYVTRDEAVINAPSTIIGATTVCQFTSPTYSSPTSGGIWTSSNTAIVTIDPTLGTIAALKPGTSTITYTIGTTSCYTTSKVTVIPGPGPITGYTSVCVGSMVALSDTSSGGVWTASNTSASVDAFGNVTGQSTTPTNLTNITYTFPNTCKSITTVTVNPLPPPITGVKTMCIGGSTSLTDALGGGTWSATPGTVAVVPTPSVGTITGTGAGTATVSYTIGSGCSATAVVTVNPNPAIITGTSGICVGATTCFSDATPLGTWSLAPSSLATIGSSSGCATGSTAGTGTITYKLSATGCFAVTPITVNLKPSSILGTLKVCKGDSTLLSDAVTGGSWYSSNTSVATVNVGNGWTDGVGAGTATISYVSGSGCAATSVVTVNPIPGPILGPSGVCAFATATMSDALGGGTWSVSNAVVSITTGGFLTAGSGTGVDTITYKITSTGCFITSTVAVKPAPTAILGNTTVCTNSTTGLSDAITGGTWTASNTVVTVDPYTGIVTSGPLPGTSKITYSLGGTCTQNITITVIPGAPLITGTPTVCLNKTTLLSDAAPSGTWTVTNANATVSSVGLVSGLAVGMDTVIFTVPGGCAATKVVTINPLPAVPSVTDVCVLSTVTLSDASGSGTWSSSITTVGTVNITTGVLTGKSAGTTTITFTLGATGCANTAPVTVNPLPAPISGPAAVCYNSTITLSDASIGGTFTSTSTSVLALSGAMGENVKGIIATGGVGTVVYTLPTGCTATGTVKVNPLPAAPTGPANVCIGSNITMNDVTPSGSWSTSGGVLTIDPTTGMVTGGSVGCAPIMYTLTTTGCLNTATVCVLNTPTAITGGSAVCIGQTLPLSSSPTPGTWTSGAPFTASVDAFGVVTGKLSGTAIISYAISTGCKATEIVTVNPLPTAITGAGPVCLTDILTMSDGTPGGVWSSSIPAVGTVDPVSGVFSPASVGTTTITYSVGCPVTAPVTVQISPAAITGPGTVCNGANITLNNSVGGGTWAASNSNVILTSSGSTATVTGNIAGVTAATSIVSYTIAGCTATQVVTINPTPVISPNPIDLCQGNKAALTTTIPGVWSTSNSAIVSITPGGVATASSTNTGAATITETLTTGCYTNVPATVNPIPAAISGPNSVCQASTITLSDPVTGGTWTTLSSTIATVDPTLGVVTGNAKGTTVITYSLSAACYKNYTVTVNPVPNAISGTGNVCAGTTVTLSSSTPGGRWTGTPSTLFVINPTTGLLSAYMTPGTGIAYYTLPTGCLASQIITINPLPAVISGPASICTGGTALFTNPAVGTWSSSTTTVATIVPSSGFAKGIGAGTSTIIFTDGTTGCNAKTNIAVLPAPGTIVAPATICVGATPVILTNPVTPGTWYSGNPAIATVDPVTGLFTPVTSGTVLVNYVTAPGAGCSAITAITVNPNSQIIGSNIICKGLTTRLVDTTLGGVWGSGGSNIYVDPGTGDVTGLLYGTDIVYYTTPKGCKATMPVTVNPVPNVLTPTPNQLCLGQTTPFNALTPGGVWSSSSTSVATITTSGLTGTATGVALGTSIISYTNSGCAAIIPVTVNALPAAVSGPSDVCVGATVTMSDATPGGKWSSSRTLMATVGASTGVVTGVATGTSSIIYTVTSTGCYANTVVNIHPVPLPITPLTAVQVCAGSITTLAESSTGGSWVSDQPGFATVNAFGDVTGVSKGVATIEYKYPGTGCSAKHDVTVNPVPVITGPAQICEAETKVIATSDPGGTWTSSTSSVATIGLTSGSAHGVASGATMLNYILPTGCATSAILTVNPLPSPVSGPASVCVGNIATFTDATPGGDWTTDLITIADASTDDGNVSGVSHGTTNVNYILSATGCKASVSFTVTDAPTVPAGNNNICLHANATYTDLVPGGVWSTLSTTIATVNATTGVVTANAVGSTTLTYTMSAGCFQTKDINVIPLPNSFTVTGGGNPCAGSGVPVGLTGSTTGVNYFLYVGGTLATGPLSGTGIPLSFGSQTTAGTYTVKASDAISGCSSDMSGTAVINVIPKVYPTVDVATGTGDTLVCNGATVTLSAKTSMGGTSPVYKWDVNGTTVSITDLPYAYIPADGDVVTFTMTSSALCATPAIVSDKVTLKVVNPVTPGATLSTNPGDTICEGKAVTFMPTAIFGGTSPTYTWIVNTVPITTGPTFTYVPTDNDVVYAKVTSNYPCLITTSGPSNSVRMKVDVPVIPHVSVAAAPSAYMAPGQSAVLTATTENGGTAPTYQWIQNGYPIPGATGATYTFTESTTAQVGQTDSMSVEVTSSGSCAMTTHQWIYLKVDHNVGVKHVSGANTEIAVVPNPNKGEFTIKGALGTNSDENVSLEMTDVLGQVVYKNNVIAKGGNIDEHIVLRKTLANGMYMLSVRSESTTQVFHVVVEQ